MIKIENLNKKLDNRTVLQEVNVEFKEGTIYGLVGINGAGKSTLIRHIAGVYKCDSGLLQYNGEDIYENPKAKKDIFFLSDSPYFFQNYTINEMKDFFKIYYDFDDELFEKLKDVFNLDLDRNLKKFSKGMKKKSDLMLALCCKPKVLLLDETFDGLDPAITIKIKSLFVDLVEERNLTLIISSHNLMGLDSICDYIYLLDNNKLRLQKDIDSNINYFKIQLYFQDRTNEEVLKMLKLNIVDVKTIGSVLNIIVKGEDSEIKNEINSHSPTIFDILPFTFEEKFIYEIGAEVNE